MRDGQQGQGLNEGCLVKELHIRVLLSLERDIVLQSLRKGWGFTTGRGHRGLVAPVWLEERRTQQMENLKQV